jgi:multiple sugar transport system substrate-binding protein
MATHLRRPSFWAGAAFGLVVAVLASLVVAAVERRGGLEPGPYELVVLSGRDDSIGGQRQQLVDEWNALHPESKARIVELSSRADAQRSEMLARAQSDGSAGAGVDVYNLDVTWTAEFADAGYLTSLDES